MTGPIHYEIRVQGHLAEQWAVCFGPFTIQNQDNGECLISGPVPDQAALHGILARVRDLGLTLVALERLEENDGGRKPEDE